MKNSKTKKIKPSDILMVVCWALYFQPPIVGRISDGLSDALMLLGFGVFGVLLVMRKNSFPIRREVITIIIAVAWCTAMIALQTPRELKAYTIHTLMPLIESAFLLRWTVRSKDYKGLKNLYVVCAFYTILNFLTLILFRRGLFVSDQGSSVARAQWILGSKNNIAIYLIVFITVTALYDYCISKNMKRFYALAAISLFTVAMSGGTGFEFFGGSSTGLMALLTVVAVVTYYLTTEKNGLPGIPVKVFLLGIAMLYVMVLGGGSLEIVHRIIVSVFKKTITYSGRASIWQVMIGHIMKHPVIGYGERDFTASVRLEGVMTTTTYVYNAVLKIMLNYGLVGLALLVYNFISVKNISETMHKLAFAGFMGLLVLGLMNELSLEWLLFFPIMMVNFYKEMPRLSEKSPAGKKKKRKRRRIRFVNGRNSSASRRRAAGTASVAGTADMN